MSDALNPACPVHHHLEPDSMCTCPPKLDVAATDEQIAKWGGEASSNGDEWRWTDWHVRALIARIREIEAKLRDVESSAQAREEQIALRAIADCAAELDAVMGPVLGCCGRRAVEHKIDEQTAQPHLRIYCPDVFGRWLLAPPEFTTWLESRK